VLSLFRVKKAVKEAESRNLGEKLESNTGLERAIVEISK
jgi:hypothetical protein